MKNISEKKNKIRIAKAKGEIMLKKGTLQLIKEGKVEKGDVFESAKLAGMLAIKKTPELIPYCHNIQITGANIRFKYLNDGLECECEVSSIGKTGVEMEALIGVSVSLLTIWDMVKYLEKDEKGQYPFTLIKNIRVVKKEKGNRYPPNK